MEDNEKNLALLKLALVKFETGEDRSPRLINEIQGYLTGKLYDDELLQDLVIAAASFTPGGGDYLYDEKMFAKVCRITLRRLYM